MHVNDSKHKSIQQLPEIIVTVITVCSLRLAKSEICSDTNLDKWQPVARNAQCPGRRHIWQPSCSGSR